MNLEPRWYVRSKGHILGPLSSKELHSSLVKGDLDLEAKITSNEAQEWLPLSQQKEWQEIVAKLRNTKTTILAIPPPPKKRGRPLAQKNLKSIEEGKKHEPIKILEQIPLSSLEPTKEIILNAPPKVDQAILPKRPDFKNIYPPPGLANTAPENHPNPRSKNMEFESQKFFELKISVSKQFAWIFIAALAIGMAYLSLEKIRGLKSFRPSDPSPSVTKPLEDDPISPLKAPTRPQRDY